MRKEEYIQEVISRIENKKARREVEQELSAHIDDRISYYTDAGWDEQTANEKAMSNMGKTEDVADKMRKLHPKEYSKALLVLTCIGVAKLIVAIAFRLMVSPYVHSYHEKTLEGLVVFFVLTEGWNYFAIKPFIVMVISTYICDKRRKIGDFSDIDYKLAIASIVIWVIDAVIAYNATSLCF